MVRGEDFFSANVGQRRLSFFKRFLLIWLLAMLAVSAVIWASTPCSCAARWR